MDIGPRLSWVITACLLLTGRCGGTAESIPVNVRVLVSRFEMTYERLRTSKAIFLETYFESGRLERVESGVAYFRKPGKMRWEYVAPEKNLFLIDGKTAWFYVPADHTVTRMPAKDSGDWRTPFALLAGKVKVSRICSKVELEQKEQPADASLVVLSCEVRGAKKRREGEGDETFPEGTAPDLVEFELARASGELRRVVVHQRGGVQVAFEFKNWEFNPAVDESKFHFQAPEGVAIVNGEAGSDGKSSQR